MPVLDREIVNGVARVNRNLMGSPKTSHFRQAARVLNLARDLIESRGWCQGGTGHGPHGELCISAALTVAGNLEQYSRLNCAILTALASIDADASLPVWWNDLSTRTKGEVINLLARAAQYAEYC